MSKLLIPKSVYYPESDGKPMGETDWHRTAIIRLIGLLEDYYRGQKVYVSGDMLVYYEQGNPKKFVVPDVFVIKGLVQKKRRIIRTWIERKAPDCIIEVTSRKTRKKDHIAKPELYARLGVTEYFLFDPEFDYLEPPLQGHRLLDGAYQRIQPEADSGLFSEQLDLRLCIVDDDLQLFRRDNGERLLTGQERADLEAAARQAAEKETAQALAEVEHLRAEVERLSNSGRSV